MTAESSLPRTVHTGLGVEVQPGTLDLFSRNVWESTKPSMTDSRSLLGVERRVDREGQKVSGVRPLNQFLRPGVLVQAKWYLPSP